MIEKTAIYRITEKKKSHLDLLLLADEQEDMIDRYLERGEMFVLSLDEEIVALCVVTQEEKGICELKNIAVKPKYHRKGLGTQLIQYIAKRYSEKFHTLLVGTGESPLTIPFYQKLGFVESHRVKNFFTDHYNKAIFEDGIQLIDMVYLKKVI